MCGDLVEAARSNGLLLFGWVKVCVDCVKMKGGFMTDINSGTSDIVSLRLTIRNILSSSVNIRVGIDPPTSVQYLAS